MTHYYRWVVPTLPPPHAPGKGGEGRGGHFIFISPVKLLYNSMALCSMTTVTTLKRFSQKIGFDFPENTSLPVQNMLTIQVLFT